MLEDVEAIDAFRVLTFGPIRGTGSSNSGRSARDQYGFTMVPAGVGSGLTGGLGCLRGAAVGVESSKAAASPAVNPTGFGAGSDGDGAGAGARA